MNVYDWYLIFNMSDFSDELVSKVYSKNLEGIGVKDILVTKGELIGLTYDGVYLPLDLYQSESLFEFEGLAVYRSENEDVYLGVLVDN